MRGLPKQALSSLEPIVVGSPQAKKVVVMLHGLGDSGEGMKPIGELFAAQMDTCFVLPTAPTRPVSINQGIPMPAWYDIAALVMIVGGLLLYRFTSKEELKKEKSVEDGVESGEKKSLIN